MKHIKSFNESDKKSFNEGYSDLYTSIEKSLIDFFESFHRYNIGIDRQWVVDRFNDEDTKRFISYMENELIKKSR